jgi:hypothetical protein
MGRMAQMVSPSILQSSTFADGKAIGFQFAKVGNDAGAERLLNSLDNDRVVGKYVDRFPSM